MNHVHTMQCLLLVLNLQATITTSDWTAFSTVDDLNTQKILTSSVYPSSPFLVTRKKKKTDPAKVKAALDAKESTPPPSKPIRVIEKTAAEKRFEDIQKKRVCDSSIRTMCYHGACDTLHESITKGHATNLGFFLFGICTIIARGKGPQVCNEVAQGEGCRKSKDPFVCHVPMVSMCSF